MLSNSEKRDCRRGSSSFVFIKVRFYSLWVHRNLTTQRYKSFTCKIYNLRIASSLPCSVPYCLLSLRTIPRQCLLNIFIQHFFQGILWNRLSQAIIASGFYSPVFVGLKSKGSQSDNRHFLWIRTNQARSLQPIHMGHLDIHQNQVGLMFFKLIHRILSILSP